MSGPRSFTVRVPYDMYLDICDLAQNEGKKLNTKVNELLKIGMGETVRVTEVLREMLLKAENMK